MSFNLVTQPFIPCLMLEGRSATYGLQDALARAHEIREVRDGSPVVTVNLHRLLLAILHRTFGPATLKAWKCIWEVGRFDTETVNGYLHRWRERFELFDEKHPFYQTGGMTTDKPLPVSALFEEMACNNNATLFDHTTNNDAQGISCSAAARGVIARQGFALGLGVSPDVTINGRRVKTGNRRDGPLARGLIVLVRGENLFQTLMLNLFQYTPSPNDVPAWEQHNPEEAVADVRVAGRLDLYTFQCRRLRLELNSGSDRVVCIHFAQGRQLHQDEVDPMKPYRRDEKRGWLPFRADENRALWRDASALLELAHDAERPIPALNWVARAIDDGVVPRRIRFDLDVFAVGTQPGKATSVIFWRLDRLPLPADYLDDVDLVGNIKTALVTAESVASSLRSAVWLLCANVLSPDRERTPDTDRVRAMVTSLAPERLYWPRLETPFRKFLVVLPGNQEHRRHMLHDWAGLLQRSASQAFSKCTQPLDTSSRTLRAIAVGHEKLQSDLHRLMEPVREKQIANAING